MPVDAVPKRIEPDAIVEALFELRFALPDLPEVFLGQVLSSSTLADLQLVRLPQADIPISAREADQTLLHQPMFQLENGRDLVRIGPASLSIHMLAPYGGWSSFQSQITEIIKEFWHSCGAPALERCALRYVNALSAEKHGVRTIEDLNIKVEIDGRQLADLSVSYVENDDEHTETMIRLASLRHVQGNLPKDASFVVDVETRSVADISRWNADELFKWIENARRFKNAHFFRLLPARIVETLQAD